MPSVRRPRPLLFSIAYCTLLACGTDLFAAKPVAETKLVTPKVDGHSVTLKADLTGAKQLFLVVTDGGDSHACDWADWIEPTLITKSGTQKLTDLKWKSASTGWGTTRINQNAGGRALSVNGRNIAFGIGTHANSVIAYDLPDDVTGFQSGCGLDDGGTSQGSCGQNASVRFAVYTEKPTVATASGVVTADRTPESALDGLTVHDALDASLFAAEPMLLSPSNIDVDHKGRVWVCEVVNYRGFRNKHTPREAGDRILILEDTDGDGAADKQGTFYQGRDVDSAHGVCVLGNKVIVSAGSEVFVLTDTDGDDKADKKDLLFTGISGTQHDHGIHSFLFGPDGRLYFNFGNEGKQLKDKDGQPIVDKRGNVINNSRKPYQEGMVFRCELDGSNVETLGWNFRNNWEVTVDSFGTLWQSDNDDDGNRGTRINFVMEYGNYGYKDELTGAGWRDTRTGMSDEIPKRHWHLNDPGVVPNLLQTGAGSPTGIMIYEGDLLPEVFRNEIIHCDAGPNVVRAYPVKNNGAGYAATMLPMLEGTRDKWFRPSDVCAAPDGSLIVADWYDPGVGGHRMVDVQRGRLFRLAPKGHDGSYTMPKYDFESIDGAITALKSPNLEARTLAWLSLQKQGATAESALVKLAQDENPRFAARAYWLLAEIDGRTSKTIVEATSEEDPNLRIVGLRIARRHGVDLLKTVEKLVSDRDPQVRRECCVALVELDDVEAVAHLWTKIALQYDGGDRWMLEALGIAARGRWDACLAQYFERIDPGREAANRDLVWRSRAETTPATLANMLAQQETPMSDVPRMLRAFDFLPAETKTEALLALAFDADLPEDRRAMVQSEALARLPSQAITNNPAVKERLAAALDRLEGTSEYVALVNRLKLADRYPSLLKIAQQHPTEQLGVEAVSALFSLGQANLFEQALRDEQATQPTLAALETSRDSRGVGVLMKLIRDRKADLELRRAAVRAAATAGNGDKQLARYAISDAYDSSLKDALAASLQASTVGEVQQVVEKMFPRPAGKDDQPMPPLSQLLSMKADAANGRVLFHSKAECAKCHKVDGLGKEVGPDLSGIGKKLSKRALLESILYPSAGISHNYETYTLVTEDGRTASGLLVSETDQEVKLKGTDAIVRTFDKSELEEMAKSKVSLMPADLQKLVTAQELVDVVSYLQTLKNASAEGTRAESSRK